MYLAYCATWGHYLLPKNVNKLSRIKFFLQRDMIPNNCSLRNKEETRQLM